MTEKERSDNIKGQIESLLIERENRSNWYVPVLSNSVITKDEEKGEEDDGTSGIQ